MTEGGAVAVRAALDRLVGQPAWAAIRLRDSATVTLVGGSLSTVQRLADVPLEQGAPKAGRRFDRLKLRLDLILRILVPTMLA